MFKKIFNVFTLSAFFTFCFFANGFILAEEPSATAQQAAPDTAKSSTVVVFETTRGTIELKLYDDAAPKTVENFKGLVDKGYYNGTIFHRVIKGFMIQGGDPTGTGTGGESIWGGTFEDEVSPSLEFDHKGLLAMANAGPNTNASQFFITTAATPWLNMKHTIFGEVVSGYETVTAIEQTQTGLGDRPVEEQKILKAYIK